VCELAFKRATEIRTQELVSQEPGTISDALAFEKSAKQVESLVKLSMQRLVGALKVL